MSSASSSSLSTVQSSSEAKMIYRHLGNSGLKVSALGFGTATLPLDKEEECYEIIQTAFKAGVNLFDCAESYNKGKAEIMLGKCLKRLMTANVSRSELVITTKLFWGPLQDINSKGLCLKKIEEGLKESLKRMQMGYVDLVYAHRPDPKTPMEEIVRAMNLVIQKGYAFYWGTSEWSAAQLTEACLVAQKLNLIAPTMEQPQYSMVCRSRVEVEYEPIFRKFHMGITSYSPLCGGILTGKHTDMKFAKDTRFAREDIKSFVQSMESGEGFDVGENKNFAGFYKLVSNVAPIAKKMGVPLSQLALAWCLYNQNVSSVITGATKLSQLVDNLKALDVLPKITADIYAELEKAMGNKPKCPPNWRIWK
eukprot:TRINITY_DN5292_c0_g1_i1.p1 TRINITY_DN5292_c0_g1~~TRINITY_DN5292_c0_g1_i1.p1  ORF type:complete len:365 (+),score=82.53 TRINITY_DN5292_c0_g1_i1:53-1147(+)